MSAPIFERAARDAIIARYAGILLSHGVGGCTLLHLVHKHADEYIVDALQWAAYEHLVINGTGEGPEPLGLGFLAPKRKEMPYLPSTQNTAKPWESQGHVPFYRNFSKTSRKHRR